MKRHTNTTALDRCIQVAASPIHGQGCFARMNFAPGDRIGVFEGVEVTEDGPHVLWVYDTEHGHVIGRRGTTVLRWLNHSDTPNAEFDGFELYARLTISIGSEITIDYGTGAP